MDQLNELNNLTQQYRKTLAEIEQRAGASTQAVIDHPFRVDGSTREKVERMDADLSAAEHAMQDAQLRRMAAENAALRAKLDEPRFSTQAARTDVLDVSSREYAQRWLKAVARGDAAEMRALSLSSSGAGIPTDMERRIVEKLQQANVLRSFCPVSTIDSKRTITVEGNLPTTALVAEAGAITPADPTFGTAISVVPYKYVCATTMSQEFIEDAIGQGGIGGGLDWVASRIGLSMALKMEEAYTTGTGSSQPEGCAGSSANTKLVALSQVTDLGTAAIGTISADNVIDTAHLVPVQYRNGPRHSWFVSDTFVKVIRKLKVNSAEYVWVPSGASNAQSLAVGVPGTIYGIPYRVGAYVPTATTNGNIFALVGNFDYFEIFDRTGMTSMVDPYSAAATHQVTLYTYARTDSRIMLANAFAAITC
jgi:HK97 family phage major capsid protein